MGAVAVYFLGQISAAVGGRWRATVLLMVISFLLGMATSRIVGGFGAMGVVKRQVKHLQEQNKELVNNLLEANNQLTRAREGLNAQEED